MSAVNYKFLQVVDAVTCVNQRVNLIGVAVETSLPKTTKGTGDFPPFTFPYPLSFHIIFKIFSGRKNM